VKRCSRCLRWLEFECFTVNRAKRDGLQHYCRECQRAYVKEHYAANTQYYLAKARRSNDKRYRLCKEAMAKLKAVPCADCGRTYPSWVMDFDHVRGEKLFNVSRGPQIGEPIMLAEAGKCEIVCSNCHRDRTHRRLTNARP
jgi:hypothetical protein